MEQLNKTSDLINECLLSLFIELFGRAVICLNRGLVDCTSNPVYYCDRSKNIN